MAIFFVENVGRTERRLKKKKDTSHPLGWLLYQKIQKTAGVGEDVEKLEPGCTVCGNVE